MKVVTRTGADLGLDEAASQVRLRRRHRAITGLPAGREPERSDGPSAQPLDTTCRDGRAFSAQWPVTRRTDLP
jgi:hypothetical protein